MNHFTKLCRLCTTRKDVTVTLNNWDSDNVTYLHKLNEIAPEILEINNELSNGVCEACIVQLNDAYQFKRKCIASHEILKQQLENGEVINKNSLKSEENVVESFEFINVQELRNDKDEEIKLDDNSKEENREFLQLYEMNKIFIKTEINEESCDEANNDISMESSSRNEETDLNLDHTEYIVEEYNSKHISYNCKICKKTFTPYTYLKKHIQSHMNERCHKCKICGKAFYLNVHLIQHTLSHTNDRDYKCEICGKAYKRKEHLNRHVRVHTNEKLCRCGVCGKAFTRNENLTTHIRTTHTSENPYTCQICEKVFKRNENLKWHIRTRHLKEKFYKCDICQKAFTRNKSLKRHLNTLHN